MHLRLFLVDLEETSELTEDSLGGKELRTLAFASAIVVCVQSSQDASLAAFKRLLEWAVKCVRVSSKSEFHYVLQDDDEEHALLLKNHFQAIKNFSERAVEPPQNWTIHLHDPDSPCGPDAHWREFLCEGPPKPPKD